MTLPKRSTREHHAGAAVRSPTGARQIELLIVGDRPAERGQGDALGQPAGGGREAIAALERAAHRRPRVLALGQLHDLARGGVSWNTARQHAVVRRHEPIVAGLGRMPRRAEPDARIDDHEEDGAGRESSDSTPPVRARRRARRAAACRGRCRPASPRDTRRARRLSSCRRSDRGAEIGQEGDDRTGHAAGGSRQRRSSSGTASRARCVFIRNESVTRRPLNIRMMSPVSRARWRGRLAGYGR